MKRICVVGTGYVGLVTGTCFSDLGNEVRCLDIDEEKIAKLDGGNLPIYEPGLEELVRRNARAGRLSFTTSYPDALRNADIVFIAVETPSGPEGEADMRYVRAAAQMVAKQLPSDRLTIIVNKSTVPVGAADLVAQIIRRKNPTASFSVVSNPEFLREGNAVADFMNPDRIVLGASEKEVGARVAELYAPLKCPVVITDLRTAEMIKYASNAFLATKISFINEIASVCDKLGADVKEVARGMGLDRRIGASFLDAGLGYGGSCFPKDVKALAHMAAIHGCHPQLLRAVMEINHDQRRAMLARIRSLFGTLEGLVIGILGLSFKPNTDDMREAAAVEIIRLLQHEGTEVRAYDPVSSNVARTILTNTVLHDDAYSVADGADALIVVTEWNEFKNLDMARIKSLMRNPVLVDGRNLYDPQEMLALGFNYSGVGRGHLSLDVQALPSRPSKARTVKRPAVPLEEG